MLGVSVHLVTGRDELCILFGSFASFFYQCSALMIN